MTSVRFFHKQLPVYGDAPVIEFDDGPHKVWSFVMRTPTGDHAAPMREKVGEVTLQERFDHYIWHEYNLLGAGPRIAFAHHFEPADDFMIDYWMSGHKKRTLQ